MTREWKERIEERVKELLKASSDGAHDFAHLERVALRAQRMALAEYPNLSHDSTLIILAAGLLHDIVSLPKDHPEAHLSSQKAADLAAEILEELNFPSHLIPAVQHAIAAHSFSGGIKPETFEAQVIQDADRIEALGLIGILRVFYCSGQLGRDLYHPRDPLAQSRELDDKEYGLDHFERKLLKLPASMQTEEGRKLASNRANQIRAFRDLLLTEWRAKQIDGPAHQIATQAHQAGGDATQLFCSLDPLAQNRPSAPETYLVDRLIALSEPTVNQFLASLPEELEL